MKYVENLNINLHNLLQEDERVILLGEDLADPYGGAFKVTKGLSTKFPDRVINTPICEASIVGTGIGLSLRGLRPIIEIMFGDFLTLTFDQIFNHASKFYAMYYGKVKLPMIIRTPMGGGRGYGPTHSQSLEKYFLGIPYVRVIAPSLFHNPGKLLIQSFSFELPVIFIEHKLLYPINIVEKDNDLIINEIKDEAGFPVMKVQNFINKKPDIIIITYGGVSKYLIEIFKKLKDEEIWVTAYFPALISPIKFDKMEDISLSIKSCQKLLIIEDGPVDFGWTAEVFSRINMPEITIKRLGSLNTIIPAAKEIENEVILSTNKIYKEITEMLA
jgi:pyruvate/2-oxoglutarate/acetoin dehydrogenase E1 component